MAYTQQDLDAIREAEIKQAQGKLPERITINGRTIQYSQMSPSARRALKAEIVRDLTKRRRRVYVARADKGV